MIILTLLSRGYRDIMKKCEAPAIPYIGLTIKDLTFVADGMGNVSDSFSV